MLTSLGVQAHSTVRGSGSATCAETVMGPTENETAKNRETYRDEFIGSFSKQLVERLEEAVSNSDQYSRSWHRSKLRSRGAQNALVRTSPQQRAPPMVGTATAPRVEPCNAIDGSTESSSIPWKKTKTPGRGASRDHALPENPEDWMNV